MKPNWFYYRRLETARSSFCHIALISIWLHSAKSKRKPTTFWYKFLFSWNLIRLAHQHHLYYFMTFLSIFYLCNYFPDDTHTPLHHHKYCRLRQREKKNCTKQEWWWSWRKWQQIETKRNEMECDTLFYCSQTEVKSKSSNDSYELRCESMQASN